MNNPLYKYLFISIVILFLGFFFGYAVHSEIKKEYRKDKDAGIPQSISTKDTLQNNFETINTYISKEDVERYLSSNYVISSYNWVSMLLVVATLVVTLLGWFLWINILDSKALHKNLEQIERDLTKDRKDFLLEKKEALDLMNTEFIELKSVLKKQINKGDAQLNHINRIAIEHGVNISRIKKRDKSQDETDRLFLENLLYCLKENNLSRLYKNLFLSQLYSTDREIRLEAAFRCRNYCKSSSQDDIEKLVEAKKYYELTVLDKEMVEKINETLEFLKTKKN